MHQIPALRFQFRLLGEQPLGTGDGRTVGGQVGSALGPIERAQRGSEVTAPPVGSVRRPGAWRPSPVGLGPGAELPGLCSRVFWGRGIRGSLACRL